MADDLSPSLRRLYTAPAEYIDSDHPEVRAFAEAHLPAGCDEAGIAAALYRAVRDGIRYDPYVDFTQNNAFRASSVLALGRGYCVGKAALYAACCRVHGIPARVGFADVKNHLTTDRLRESMGTDVFAWHGYTEVYLDGAWVKATPTFNATLCVKLGVAPLDFDGKTDALLHPFDGEGRAFMRYETVHGAFYDVPAKFIVAEMLLLYPVFRDRKALEGRDMEAEASMHRE